MFTGKLEIAFNEFLHVGVALVIIIAVISVIRVLLRSIFLKKNFKKS